MIIRPAFNEHGSLVVHQILRGTDILSILRPDNFSFVHDGRKLCQVEISDGPICLFLPIEYEAAFKKADIRSWSKNIPANDPPPSFYSLYKGEQYAVFTDRQNRQIIVATQALANSIVPAYLAEQFLSRRFETAVNETKPYREKNIPHRITMQPDGTIVVDVFEPNAP